MPTIRNTVVVRRKEPPKPWSWTPTKLFDALRKNEPLSVDVPAMPDEALKFVRSHGFRLATMKGFTWIKTTANGKEHFGMGHYTRANSEDCLFAMRGKWTELRKSRSVRQIVTAQVRAHSQKPDEVRDRLVELCGDVPRIELFARSRHEGWDAWGDQL